MFFQRARIFLFSDVTYYRQGENCLWYDDFKEFDVHVKRQFPHQFLKHIP